MNKSRRIAGGVGVLYIVGTVTGVLSVVLTGGILDAPNYLANVSADSNRMIAGALLVLTMGLALAMVPVLVFPVLKKQNQLLALGYLLFRGALETVTYMTMVISSLLLVTLSRLYLQAGAPAASYFETLATLFSEAGDWIAQVTTVVFILGAVMFYYTLYAARLIPRWLSGWGLIAALPYLIAGFLVIFGLIDHMSTADALLRVPLGLQEMVLAVWLIVKGFNSSAVTSLQRKGQER